MILSNQVKPSLSPPIIPSISSVSFQPAVRVPQDPNSQYYALVDHLVAAVSSSPRGPVAQSAQVTNLSSAPIAPSFPVSSIEQTSVVSPCPSQPVTSHISYPASYPLPASVQSTVQQYIAPPSLQYAGVYYTNPSNFLPWHTT